MCTKLFSALLYNKHLYLKTWLFLGSGNFCIKDRFFGVSDDSKPVDDFLRAPLLTITWMELGMGDIDGGGGGRYRWYWGYGWEVGDICK